jgi:mRNA-degrading endonuclease YafQ of YafQ-DinJ toxin-antitoxin module
MSISRKDAPETQQQVNHKLHITGYWLVVYRIDQDELQLVLTRNGSHQQQLSR